MIQNTVYHHVRRLRMIREQMHALQGVEKTGQKRVELTIHFRQERKRLLHELSIPAHLSALFHDETLMFCHTLVRDYLEHTPHSKWSSLLPRLIYQYERVQQLESIAGKALEHLTVTYQHQNIFQGVTILDVRRRLKDIIREIRRFFSQNSPSNSVQESPRQFGSLSLEDDEVTPSKPLTIQSDVGNIASRVNVMEQVETYLHTCFHVLETQHYHISDLRDVAWDVLFEIREEQGLRVKGLFVDKEQHSGHVDDIVVLVAQGTGNVSHGVQADRRMRLAVENAFDAAARFVDDTPEHYSLSWQVRNIGHRYDGDSLGLAIAISVVARLLDQTLPSDMAFTGVVTKDCEVMKVGGIRQKLEVAKQARLRKVVIPFANKYDVPEKFLYDFAEPVSTLEEAVQIVFPDLSKIYATPC